ncbi:MAG: hypothetical protein M3443_12175, partial [Actinomycetota bacterium]|nr:hypothetical protein [Actinomycetota bacterium]
DVRSVLAGDRIGVGCRTECGGYGALTRGWMPAGLPWRQATGLALGDWALPGLTWRGTLTCCVTGDASASRHLAGRRVLTGGVRLAARGMGRLARWRTLATRTGLTRKWTLTGAVGLAPVRMLELACLLARGVWLVRVCRVSPAG